MEERTRKVDQYFVTKAWMIFVFVMVTFLSIGALLLPIAFRPDTYNIYVGAISPQDIQAPYAISYISDALTEQAIQSAIQAVPDRYFPPNPAITKNQLDQLSSILTLISNCRADQYATQKQRIADIKMVSVLHLTDSVAASLIFLNDQQWNAVKNETIRVLEQIFRETIVSSNIEEIRRKAFAIVQYDSPAEHVAIISSLINPLITINSQVDGAATLAVKKEVAESTPSIIKSFIPGEVIVRRGQLISPSIYEALDHFGLIKPKKNISPALAVASFVILSFIILLLYLNRQHGLPVKSLRALLLVSIFFLIVLYSARFLIPNRTIIPYLYPIAAFGLTLATLFNFEFSLVVSLILSILITYQLSNNHELTNFFLITSLSGMIVIGKGRRLIDFIYSGLAISASGIIVILAYRIPEGITDLVGLISLTGTSLLNGAASASLAILVQYVFAQILGVPTALQLLDISRPDHPLLQYMLRKCPGSYQHSLQVANLAEQGAEAIHADSLLVRVGAIYHDVGKAENPLFFIENQLPGNIDTHDELDPAVSAEIIIKHVSDGVKLAKKYHIPTAIQHFIVEHHGTMITKYQYSKALQLSSSAINIDCFRYPGPKPQSNETAILLLADGCEAKVRAELPSTDEELSKIIGEVFASALHSGQLEDTKLTLNDLKRLQDSFKTTLINTYHPRLQYPEVPIST